MLKRINEALPGLVVSILLYGVMVELIGVWFVKDRIAYSIGVWFGIAVAVGMAINLATVIFDSVTMGDTAHATRRIVTKSILRYVVVVILFVLFGYFQWGNLIAAFLGLLGLKIGAYLQPLWEKVKGGGDYMNEGILLASDIDFMIHGIFKVKVFGQEVWITDSHACILIVMAVMVIFAVIANRKLKACHRKTGYFQNIIELIVEKLDGMVDSTMGKWAPRFVNYISTIFIFILMSNISGLFGLRPPTADYGTTLALALITFFMIRFNKAKHQSLKEIWTGMCSPLPPWLPTMGADQHYQ